jgi:hypothetical protein
MAASAAKAMAPHKTAALKQRAAPNIFVDFLIETTPFVIQIQSDGLTCARIFYRKASGPGPAEIRAKKIK